MLSTRILRHGGLNMGSGGGLGEERRDKPVEGDSAGFYSSRPRARLKGYCDGMHMWLDRMLTLDQS